MAEELQGLLNRIKEEGISKVEAEKQAILTQARKEAEALLSRARAEAEELSAKARKDAALTQEKGEAALKQAARDLLIAVRESVKKELAATVGLEVSAAMNPSLMTSILEHLVSAFAAKGGNVEGLEVLLNAQDLKQLEALVVGKFTHRLKKGVTLTPVPDIDAGIKVGMQGESLYFDFTNQAITEALCAYLNPRIARLTREAGGK